MDGGGPRDGARRRSVLGVDSSDTRRRRFRYGPGRAAGHGVCRTILDWLGRRRNDRRPDAHPEPHAVPNGRERHPGIQSHLRDHHGEQGVRQHRRRERGSLSQLPDRPVWPDHQLLRRDSPIGTELHRPHLGRSAGHELGRHIQPRGPQLVRPDRGLGTLLACLRAGLSGRLLQDVHLAGGGRRPRGCRRLRP